MADLRVVSNARAPGTSAKFRPPPAADSADIDGVQAARRRRAILASTLSAL